MHDPTPQAGTRSVRPSLCSIGREQTLLEVLIMLFGELQRLTCPHCDHFIEFRRADAGVASLAMLSHLERRHGFPAGEEEAR